MAEDLTQKESIGIFRENPIEVITRPSTSNNLMTSKRIRLMIIIK